MDVRKRTPLNLSVRIMIANLVKITILAVTLALTGCGECDSRAEFDAAYSILNQLTEDELLELHSDMKALASSLRGYTQFHGDEIPEPFRHLKPRAVTVEKKGVSRIYVRQCGLDAAVVLNFYLDLGEPHKDEIVLVWQSTATKIEEHMELWRDPN